jgi:hypothetical protein
MKRSLRVLMTAAALAPACTVAGAAQSAATFKARLSVAPIDFTTAPQVTGSGSATATLTDNTLSVTGTFEGLSSPATFAKIHDGPRGIRGPAVWDVTVTKDTRGTIKASLKLTTTEIEHLRQGRYYIQIHSEKAPDGNLWGWLLAEERRQ